MTRCCSNCKLVVAFTEGHTSPPFTQIAQLQRRNWAIDPDGAAKDNKRLGALTDAKKQVDYPLLNPATPKDFFADKRLIITGLK